MTSSGNYGNPHRAVNEVHRHQDVSHVREIANASRSDVDYLLMVVEALWDILKEQHGFEDQELFRRITEIDLRDGKLDGKVKKTQAPDCPHCGRKMMGRKPVCMYCGKPSIRNLFDR